MQANQIALIIFLGLVNCTSLLIEGLRLGTKHLKRKELEIPLVQLTNASN